MNQTLAPLRDSHLIFLMSSSHVVPLSSYQTLHQAHSLWFRLSVYSCYYSYKKYALCNKIYYIYPLHLRLLCRLLPLQCSQVLSLLISASKFAIFKSLLSELTFSSFLALLHVSYVDCNSATL